MSQKISTQEFLALIGRTDLPCETEERFLIFSLYKGSSDKAGWTEFSYGKYTDVVEEFKQSKSQGFEVTFYDIKQQKIIEIETEWPPLDIDVECLGLCDAINRIPGLKTYSSCSGHYLHAMKIGFNAVDIRSLYILAKCVDQRYGGNGNWHILVHNTDMDDNPVVFTLTSGTDQGDRAFLESTKLAERILKEIRQLD